MLLDVRERDEFRAVRVEGRLFIPMSQLGARLHEIPKDRPVLVICASGSRSTSVTGYLLAQGWEDVGNVAGGIDDLGADGPAGQARPGRARRGPAPRLTGRPPD